MRRNCFCLRHQLRVVRRQVKLPQLTIADRTIMAALSQRMSRAAQVGMLVQPETVLGWHRELVRRKWATLILQMAKDNPRWGCVRIRGELLKLGHRVSATAIRKLLRKTRLGGTVEIAPDLEGVSASAGRSC